jgi:predicted nucleic acid-binding protein
MSEKVRAALRASPLASQLRLLRMNWIARTGAHQRFEFAQNEQWRDALARATNGKRVLIATNLGGHFPLATIDRLLGVALTLRGASVTHVLCDRALPACQMCEIGLTPSLGSAPKPDRLLCGYCHAPAEASLAELGLTVARLGDSLTPTDRADAEALAREASLVHLNDLHFHGVAIGEHALAGALRHFGRSDLGAEARGERVLRRYIEAAALTAAAYARLIDELAPEVLVAHHGIYVPQGLAAAVARAKGVRVVTWNPAYRRHCFIFSHDDTYHHTLLNEPLESWRDRPLSEAERARVTEYLRSRREGREDWIRFHRDPDYALTADRLDASKPLIVALTNVFWDAQLHYPANAFPSQAEWLIDTIEYFSKRPDLQLAIRVHPAEISGSPPSRQRAADVIAGHFPALPSNIKLVGPESALSTYALCDQADAVLIFGTKTGVELSAIGIPVIVAGEAWVRGKGFTHDATSQADYRAKLDLLPFGLRLPAEQQELALRYANHFFFRRMLELPFVEPVVGPARYRMALRNLDDLALGRWPGLDTICAGILEMAPFVCDTAPDQ